MKIEQAHRVKTFALAVAVLLSTIAAGGAWIDGSVPLDAADSSVETLSPKAEESAFVQSGGVVPDPAVEIVAADRYAREATADNTRVATVH